MVSVKSFGVTDAGVKRKENHDAFSIFEDLGLFVCCDGVSGNAGASEASSICINTIQKYIISQSQSLKEHADSSIKENRNVVAGILEKAVIVASEKVYRTSQKKPHLKGMATTVDTLLIMDDYAFLAHVGDSRTYLLRENTIHQLTVDHDYATELVLKENKTVAEANRHIYANVLTRAVGASETITVDVLEVELTEGDQFLLCSDGLYRYYKNEEILSSMQGKDCIKVAPQMIDQAKKRGGRDNLTAVILQVSKSESKLQEDVRAKIKSVQKMGLFEFMEYQDLIRVLSVATIETFQPNEVIISEGSEGQTMHVVVSGKISIKKGNHEIAVGKQGDAIGEMSLIENAPRSATVIAIEPVTMLVFQRTDLFSLFRTELQVAVKFFWSLSKDLTKRLRTTTEKLAEAKEDIERLEKDLPFPH